VNKLIYGFIVVLLVAASAVVFSQAGDINARFAQLQISSVTATAAELNILDGVVATTAEINRVADISTKIVTLTGDTSITTALHGGKIILLGEVGGDAKLSATLPEATGTGVTFHFIISVANTAEYEIQVATDDIFDGAIQIIDGNLQTAANSTEDYTAATSDTANFDSDLICGDVGDWVIVTDILTGIWAIDGQCRSDGDAYTTVWAAEQS
jgi:hypothetical protein